MAATMTVYGGRCARLGTLSRPHLRRHVSAIWWSRARSGYKRIIVGAGHLAKELAGYEQIEGEDDGVVDPDEEGRGYVTPGCWKPAVLLKGRSYMYGLEDGVIPQAPCQ